MWLFILIVCHSGVILKTQKIVLDASLLNTQYYKICIKSKWMNQGKVVVPSPTLWFSSYWKEAFGLISTMVGQFTVSLNLYRGILIVEFYNQYFLSSFRVMINELFALVVNLIHASVKLDLCILKYLICNFSHVLFWVLDFKEKYFLFSYFIVNLDYNQI